MKSLNDATYEELLAEIKKREDAEKEELIPDFVFNNGHLQSLLYIYNEYLIKMDGEMENRDYSAAHLYCTDMADIIRIITLMNRGNHVEAIHHFRTLDAAVRDECPEWIHELNAQI